MQKNFILLSIPSDAEVLRSRVSHNWLEKLLLRRSGYIACLHQKPQGNDQRQDFDRFIRPGGEYEQYFAEARRLVQVAVEGFSPAQIVEMGPLGDMSQDGREYLKTVLHHAYRKATLIDSLMEPMIAALDEYEIAFREFQGTWYRDPPSLQDEIVHRFEELLVSVRRVQIVIDKLPKGIVIP